MEKKHVCTTTVTNSLKNVQMNGTKHLISTNYWVVVVLRFFVEAERVAVILLKSGSLHRGEDVQTSVCPKIGATPTVAAEEEFLIVNLFFQKSSCLGGPNF